jgi:glucose-1-phosphate thymidylyltransferase
MKCIIPAAGRGTRLGMGCKPLVEPKGDWLIMSALKNALKLGISEAIIIQADEQIHKTVGDNLIIAKGDGSHKVLKLKYVTQSEPKGIAHAISLAKPFIDKNESILVFLGDVIYEGDDLIKMKEHFDNSEYGCLIAAQKVEDKSLIKKSYGIYGNTKFIEKPKDEDIPLIEPLLGLGIYMFRTELFDAINKTPVSSLRNEIEITDTLNNFDIRGYFLLNGNYKNINTPEDLI